MLIGVSHHFHISRRKHMSFTETMKEKAVSYQNRLVLPEGTETRTFRPLGRLST
jgi:hypothetical protein